MFEAPTRNPETEQSEAPPRRRSLKAYALGLLVALALGAAAVAPYFFTHTTNVGGKKEYHLILTHDIVNHFFFMNQFEAGLRSGALYPRWYADANNGYGIAIPNYYPPGFYYLTTLTNAVFHNWHTTLFVLMALVIAGAGAALYVLARLWLGRTASAAAALLYMLLPYHLIDLYWRGAMGELFSFIFMPLMLYFAYRAGSRGDLRAYAGLGLTYGLHLLTQLPVGLMFSYALAFYALVWAFYAKDWRILLRVAIGMSLGLALSAVYWLPAALELKLVYEYHEAVYPYHLVYINPVPAQTDAFSRHIQNILKLNALLFIIAGIVLHLTSAGGKGDDPATDAGAAARRLHIKLWMIVGSASLFMTTAFSYDIGRWLPKLEMTVPPFRWLAIGAMFGALVIGACVERLWGGAHPVTRRMWALRAALALVVGVNLWVSGSKVIAGAIDNQTFTPPVSFVESGMTPLGATPPEQLPDTPLVVCEPSGGVTQVETWMPQRRMVRVQVEQPSQVRLKTYNFAGWRAWLDGQAVPITSDADGIQVVAVPPGSHMIDVRFQNTVPRWAGTWITLLAFAAIVALAVVGRRQVMRQARAAATDSAARGAAGDKQWVRYVVIAGTLLAALAIVIALAIRPQHPQSSSPASAPGQRSTPTSVGGDAVLYLDGQQSVYVAGDEQALPELLGALAAGESGRSDALVQSGRVLRVPNNTKVKVLETAAGKMKVRLLEGDHALQTGWVVDRWVR